MYVWCTVWSFQSFCLLWFCQYARCDVRSQQDSNFPRVRPHPPSHANCPRARPHPPSHPPELLPRAVRLHSTTTSSCPCGSPQWLFPSLAYFRLGGFGLSDVWSFFIHLEHGHGSFISAPHVIDVAISLASVLMVAGQFWQVYYHCLCYGGHWRCWLVLSRTLVFCFSLGVVPWFCFWHHANAHLFRN